MYDGLMSEGKCDWDMPQRGTEKEQVLFLLLLLLVEAMITTANDWMYGLGAVENDFVRCACCK